MKAYLFADYKTVTWGRREKIEVPENLASSQPGSTIIVADMVSERKLRYLGRSNSL